jgi:hypothetical protein
VTKGPEIVLAAGVVHIPRRVWTTSSGLTEQAATLVGLTAWLTGSPAYRRRRVARGAGQRGSGARRVQGELDQPDAGALRDREGDRALRRPPRNYTAPGAAAVLVETVEEICAGERDGWVALRLSYGNAREKAT